MAVNLKSAHLSNLGAQTPRVRAESRSVTATKELFSMFFNGLSDLFRNVRYRYAGIRHVTALADFHRHYRVQVHLLYLGNIFYQS